ncbi:MAG: DUF3179 domain-containing (seleno)protein, partial [Desulfovibrio sp.]|nr:DUF3179 domain-containing (seleno)protein [Desulfovibrio sp.]
MFIASGKHPVTSKKPSAEKKCSAFAQFFSLLLFALLTLFVCLPEVEARPKSMEALAAITGKLVETGVKYGAIPSLYRPRYDRVIDADLNTSAEEVVFVVMLPNGPHIYPQRFMVWHQVVNELVDDEAYAITYCPTTGTLMAYNASM